jgi:hypothetical protein
VTPADAGVLYFRLGASVFNNFTRCYKKYLM